MKPNTNNNVNIDYLLETIIEKVKKDINCIKIGKVVKFYEEDKTADVEIMFKIRENNGTITDYPQLLKCLVMGNKITLPIEEGEYCLILFNDVNLDCFFENSQKQVPYTQEKHTISDGIIITGLNNLINKIKYDNTAICLNYILNKIKGKLEVDKETTLKDTLEVEKKTTLKDELETQKDARFLMNVNITLNLNVVGNINCNNLTATTISCGGMSVSSNGVEMTKPLNSTEKITTSNEMDASSYKVGGVAGASGTKVITNPETGTTLATITVTNGIVTNIS